MEDQQPSVGRAVHYVAYGTPGGEYPAGICRAATITQVTPAAEQPERFVGLFIMNPTGCFYNIAVPYSEAKLPGTWHWPERV